MNAYQPIRFVDADAQSIQTELIQAYQNKTGTILYPGDPRRVFLLQLVPVLLALRNDINFTGNQNLLPFAEGEVLDALGERMGVTRLRAQPAKVTMEFTLSAIQVNDITVPKGTRVTPDGLLYFVTKVPLVIISGETSGRVLAEASEGGEHYNDFVPGQINIIADPIPFVASANNINISYGGSNEETDDAYRERQRIAPASFSVAGPENAYIFHAKSADVNIVDVAVTSPAPGQVNIYPLMKDGLIPDSNVINNVLNEVNQKNRRPLTDFVSVLAPTVVNYEINVTYYISEIRSAEVASIREKIEGPNGAIEQFIKWQYAKLGRAITPDELQYRMYQSGAYRAVVTSPTFTEIDKNKFGVYNVKNVTYGGLI